MGREFRGAAGTRAEWFSDGSGAMLRTTVSRQDIPAFIKWLEQGPPQPRYRIRDGVTFDFIPDYVSGKPEPRTCTTYNMPVDPADIEEVWE